MMVCLLGFKPVHGTVERVREFIQHNAPSLVDSGELRSIFVPLQPESQMTHAFVGFLHQAAATEAVRALNGTYWQGTRITAV
jgi:hypothetical protein